MVIREVDLVERKLFYRMLSKDSFIEALEVDILELEEVRHGYEFNHLPLTSECLEDPSIKLIH